MLFKVVEIERGIVWNVYGVQSLAGKTKFLFHDGQGWFWDDMKHYKPIV